MCILASAHSCACEGSAHTMDACVPGTGILGVLIKKVRFQRDIIHKKGEGVNDCCKGFDEGL
jgi:hypothetical protein